MKEQNRLEGKMLFEWFSFIVTNGDECKIVNGGNYGEFHIRYQYYESAVETIVNELLPDITTANFKIESEYSYITKHIYESVSDYVSRYGFQIILSNNTVAALEKGDPRFLKEISDKYITETEWENQQAKSKKRKNNIIDRIVAISKSTNISLLEKKIYIYLLGCQIKRNTHPASELYLLDYDRVSDELSPTLNVKKKEVIKTINRLKTKGLIEIKRIEGFLIFSVIGTGPADLNFGYTPSGGKYE